MSWNKLLIYVGFPSIAAVEREFPKGASDGVNWLYLGHKQEELDDFEKHLPCKYIGIPLTRGLNTVADRIRGEFTHWIDELNSLNGVSLAWWLGRISSRNIYNSDLFHSACYIETLDCIWESSAAKPSFIIVNSNALAETVKSWAERRSVKTDVRGFELSTFVKLARMLARQILDPLFFTFRLRAAKGSKSGNNRENSLNHKFVLLDVFIERSAILKDGAFTSRFLPSLEEYLERCGCNVVYSPVFDGFFRFGSLYKKIRQSGRRFVIPEDYLRWKDYWEAFRLSLAQLFLNPKCIPFRGNTYSAIVASERYSGVPLLNALLIYKLMSRLKDTGFRPDFAIDWYENQIVDKAFIKGLRDNFNGIKIVGVQSFIHAANRISESPSSSELKNNFVPDVVLCTSEYQCLKTKLFADTIKARPAAALRYAHLFDKSFMRKKASFRALGVLCSYDMNETLGLIRMVKKAGPLIKGEYKVIIKCHPALGKDRIAAKLGKNYLPEDRFEFREGPISEFFAASDVIAVCNSSSGVEAVARGVPAVFVCLPGNLGFNPFENLKTSLCEEAFTSDELADGINKSLQHDVSSGYFHEEASKMLNMFFTPVSEDSLKPFLPD